jgi:hypothetical protein
VQHGSPDHVASRSSFAKKLRAKRTAKSRPTMASDEAGPSVATRK